MWTCCLVSAYCHYITTFPLLDRVNICISLVGSPWGLLATISLSSIVLMFTFRLDLFLLSHLSPTSPVLHSVIHAVAFCRLCGTCGYLFLDTDCPRQSGVFLTLGSPQHYLPSS